MTVRPAKTQISLGIRPVCSESSLCAQWVAKDPIFLHADSEDSDQTGRMPRLIRVFAGRTVTLLVLSCHLKAKCLKVLNLLKVLSHTSWGADRTILLHLYRSLIQSKLDYGAIVYGSPRKSYLAMLDTVHHQGLRLALGAFRTSPVENLYVEADPSLYLRREKLALQYAIRLAANPSNPAYKITFPPHISEDIINLYENKPNVIKSFGLRIQPL